MLPPDASTSATASALNSGVNFRRFLPTRTPFRARTAHDQVSVKAGQLHVLFDPSEAKFFEVTNAAPFLRAYGYDPTAVFAQIRGVKRWPSVPLVVLSRDPARAVSDKQATAEQEQIWTAGALAYARLSPHGTRTVVPGSSHYVYLDAPDAAAAAIRKVLRQAS